MRRIVLAVALVAAACDPEGPGARGMLSLDPMFDPSAYTELHLRTFPEPVGFDLAVGYDAHEWSSSGVALASVTFPYAYEVGEPLGTTNVQQWRVIAWLSTTAESEWPASGAPYGTRTYAVGACPGIDGFCDKTSGVDFAIDTSLP